MQTATVTIVVESDGPAFSPESNDIQDKAIAKLQADITETPAKAE